MDKLVYTFDNKKRKEIFKKKFLTNMQNSLPKNVKMIIDDHNDSIIL